MSEMETVNITSPPSSPPEDFTVNLSDPWTISALILYITPSANAETSKYFCTGEVNQFFISINTYNGCS